MDFPFVKEAISQLFSKPSCAMYPAVPSEAAPNYRGRIVYHADKVHRAAACASASAPAMPSAARSRRPREGDKITLTFNLGSCIFCATCADFCSRKAIELTGDYHMIATKEEDLLVTGQLYQEAARQEGRSRPRREACGRGSCRTCRSSCSGGQAPQRTASLVSDPAEVRLLHALRKEVSRRSDRGRPREQDLEA